MDMEGSITVVTCNPIATCIYSKYYYNSGTHHGGKKVIENNACSCIYTYIVLCHVYFTLNCIALIKIMHTYTQLRSTLQFQRYPTSMLA